MVTANSNFGYSSYQQQQQWQQQAYRAYSESPYYRSWLQRSMVGQDVHRGGWHNFRPFQRSQQGHGEATSGQQQASKHGKKMFDLIPHCKELEIAVVFNV